jgi:hypothetical protein
MGVESHLLWEKKYLFNEEMLPSFVNEEFGRKVNSHLLHLNRSLWALCDYER